MTMNTLLAALLIATSPTGADPTYAHPGPASTFAGHLGSVERITEDDERWDCTTMGDHECGPTNAQGVPAGCYDEGGVLVALWPCYVVVNPDGSSDVYTTPDNRQ